jgi:opacity protein-like surface antigen
MKKLYVLLSILVITFSLASGQLTKIGGGLNWGTGFHYINQTSGTDQDLYRSPFAGIYLKAVFDTKSPVQISPSFAFFIPRNNSVPDIGSTSRTTKLNEIMFDLNGHYVFFSPDYLKVYGLTGFDITLATIKGSDPSFSSGVDNALGINLGAGLSLKITDHIDFNSEAKFIAGKYHQILIYAGVLVDFGFLKKDMNSKK